MRVGDYHARATYWQRACCRSRRQNFSIINVILVCGSLALAVGIVRENAQLARQSRQKSE
jgi:hypothetical protein